MIGERLDRLPWWWFFATNPPVSQLNHGQNRWVGCDFSRHFRGKQKTNQGTQPADVSAYAVDTIDVPTSGEFELSIGFDDSISVWLDGEQILSATHDSGFLVKKKSVELTAGEVEIRVKLDNRNNAQWRLWAFSLSLRSLKK